MGKFALECPKCGSINTASTFVFAKKVIKCGTCQEEINVKTSRLISKACPKCGSVFICDQAKVKGKKCPICGTGIEVHQAATAQYKMVTVNCPQCACAVEVDKTKLFPVCPVCDCRIDVAKELAKAKLVSDTGVSVIQYEGDNSTFVWKHPIENFNFGSQLIIHESQEAVFFLNGQALDLFGPGRYTLETENLPVLKKVSVLPTGRQTPFHAEVYFINKTVQMGIKWGTDSRVSFIDPMTGIPLDIGAAGEMNVQVSDSKKLLFKLVGTTGGLARKDILEAKSDSDGIKHKTLQSFFRAPLMTQVKSYLAAVIKQENLNIFELDEKMGVLSDALRDRISPKFEEYGLSIPQFYITTISLPEDDPNFKNIKALISQAYLGVRSEQVKAGIAEAARERQLIEEQTKVQLEVMKAQGRAEAARAIGFAEAEVMRAKGYTQKDILEADVQKAYAQGMGNMGGGSVGSAGGGMASDMVSMMAGLKMAGMMSGKLDEFFGGKTAGQPTGSALAGVASSGSMSAASGVWNCSCGAQNITSKFCPDCGKQRPIPNNLWNCPNCGASGITSRFCPECGTKKPE